MAVAYRDSTTYNSGAGTVSSFNINLPAAAVPPDYLVIAIAFTGGTGVTITPPAGFSFLGISQNFTTVWGVAIYRKLVASGESSYTFGLSSAQSVSAVAYAASDVRLLGGGTFFPEAGSGSGGSSGSTTQTITFSPYTADPAFGLKFVASYNTGGVFTVTGSGSGYTLRNDTSTTAGSFVEMSVADGGAGNFMRNVTVPASTLSGSAPASGNAIFAIGVRSNLNKVITPNIDYQSRLGFNSVSSGAVGGLASIPSERAVILVFIQNAAATVTSITATGLTWKQVAVKQDPSNTARVEMWTTTLGVNGVNYISTVNLSGSAVFNVITMTYPASGDITNILTANNSTGVATSTLTTATANSLVEGAIIYAANIAPTENNGNSLQNNSAYAAGAGSVVTLKQFATTKGSSITSSVSAPTTSPWAMIQYEVPMPTNTGNFLQFM